MAIYLDTSALVKLYVFEDGRDIVHAAVRASEDVTSSTVAYAEARAALARKRNGGDLDEEGLHKAVAGLNQDWPTFATLEVTDPIARYAGELAQKHALRGYDAVHLASALTFADGFERLYFLSFDKRLNDAARETSLIVYGDTPDAG